LKLLDFLIYQNDIAAFGSDKALGEMAGGITGSMGMENEESRMAIL